MKAENGDRIVLRFEANWGTGDWFIDIDDISVTHVATNPVFSINPTSKQYGDVEVGSFADQVFTISNLGLNPLVINDGGLSINGADATAYTIINTNPYPISITATPVTITVRFTPPAIRETPYAAALQIVDNTAKATQSVPLNGSGVGTYTLDVFAEGFNGTTFPPAGWSNYSITKSNGAVNPTGYWSRRTAGTYGSTAGAAFISWNYSSSVWACLEAPTLNLPSKSKLSFYWRDHDSKIAGQDTTFCEISTNGGTSWTVLAFLAAATTQTTYQKVDISLNAYAGSDRLLRFRDGTNTSSSAYGTFVDELSIVGGYDFPEGIPVSVGEEIITVTGGNANVGSGQVPPVVNTNFVASSSYVLNLIGSGPWTITIATSAPWGAYYQNGAWMSVENVGGFITFVITAAKDIPSLPIILGPVDPTLPVELSSFAATLTADMFVNVAWVAASETNHLGYNVLRSENNMLGNAIQINQNVITEGTSVGTQVSYSYLDTEVEANGTYYYWLESLDLGGTSVMHGPVSILVTGEPGDPGTPPLPPTVTKLMSAYPNPFNPSTNIRYSLKEAGKVSIEIYNVKGQLIRTYENNHSAPGYYQIMWDGRDASGRAVSSGLYLYRMISGHYRESRKMVLAK
ncbi:MAG: FlgD immunoglobulin-like domain containing protein [Candidatus Cloacimonadaceae bacterium]|nr:FlgD immunoglobulin-like domain containing protein [Candidatus Cloacimonadaceae bacterium]